MPTHSIDFLAVGDTVIDTFIDLLDAKVHCDINDENCTISMRFGDKIPYKDVNVIPAVGNSPNASVSAARLGLSSAIITHLGDDEDGEKCKQTLADNGVNTDYVVTEEEKRTNNHYVLQYDAERTILINHEAYTYDFPAHTEDMPVPRWIYFSSVAENALPYHDQIAAYLAEHPETNLAFQPGTFQISLGYEKLKDIYQACEVFFCNVEEARRILKTADVDTQPGKEAIPDIVREMHSLGPAIVCITDGPDGAYAYDGTEMWHMPMYPDPKEPIDRTGAGDSFSSTFTTALALGKSLPEALTWGPVNSMSVVQYVGAQEGLLSQDKLLKHLDNAPDHYKPQQIA